MSRSSSTARSSRWTRPAKLVAASSALTRLLVPADRLSLADAQAIPGVVRASVDGDSVVLETEDSGPVLSAVDALAGLHGVQTRTASLEDVYLELTGSAQSPSPSPSPSQPQPQA